MIVALHDGVGANIGKWAGHDSNITHGHSQNGKTGEIVDKFLVIISIDLAFYNGCDLPLSIRA